jgi:hypothetical protein
MFWPARTVVAMPRSWPRSSGSVTALVIEAGWERGLDRFRARRTRLRLDAVALAGHEGGSPTLWVPRILSPRLIRTFATSRRPKLRGPSRRDPSTCSPDLTLAPPAVSADQQPSLLGVEPVGPSVAVGVVDRGPVVEALAHRPGTVEHRGTTSTPTRSYSSCAVSTTSPKQRLGVGQPSTTPASATGA